MHSNMIVVCTFVVGLLFGVILTKTTDNPKHTAGVIVWEKR